MDTERPFGEPQSSEEPRDLELRRAHEHGRGRHATHPMQIPWLSSRRYATGRPAATRAMGLTWNVTVVST